MGAGRHGDDRSGRRRIGIGSRPRSAGPAMKRLAATLVLVPVLLLLAGCGSSKDETPAPATACTPDKLPTKAKGTLTVATDKPAYPPYFEDDEPANGEGFESAAPYALGQ